LQFDGPAVDTLVGYADGDARRFLNLLEQCNTAAGAAGITTDRCGLHHERAEPECAPLRQGRRQFLRPDLGTAQVGARVECGRALYWLCRMLDGGADARYLSRRIVRMAWEDIGLADPRALQIANDAAPPSSGWAARRANWRWARR
jgi:putative ATPase